VPLGGVPEADYAPPGGPPRGLTPLGDWTPPEGAPAPWAQQAAPAPSPYGPPPAPVHDGGPILAGVANRDDGITPSAMKGNAYLAGMAMGLWWGLIGAIILFLTAATQITSGEFGSHLPKLLVICLMFLCFGVLAYGLIALWGVSTDNPEGICGGLGAGLGILTSIVVMKAALGAMGMFSIGGLFGTIWVSWKMGASLGANLAESMSSVFIVAAGGGVAVTRNR
jgi:hypothetical protein